MRAEKRLTTLLQASLIREANAGAVKGVVPELFAQWLELRRAIEEDGTVLDFTQAVSDENWTTAVHLPFKIVFSDPEIAARQMRRAAVALAWKGIQLTGAPLDTRVRAGLEFALTLGNKAAPPAVATLEAEPPCPRRAAVQAIGHARWFAELNNYPRSWSAAFRLAEETLSQSPITAIRHALHRSFAIWSLSQSANGMTPLTLALAYLDPAEGIGAPWPVVRRRTGSGAQTTAHSGGSRRT